MHTQESRWRCASSLSFICLSAWVGREGFHQKKWREYIIFEVPLPYLYPGEVGFLGTDWNCVFLEV
jgi:hypothetical protein